MCTNLIAINACAGLDPRYKYLEGFFSIVYNTIYLFSSKFFSKSKGVTAGLK